MNIFAATELFADEAVYPPFFMTEPTTMYHPPSLKNPKKVLSDNPDEPAEENESRKKRKRRVRRETRERLKLARRSAAVAPVGRTAYKVPAYMMQDVQV